MLDAAGFPEVRILASNELDEQVIDSTVLQLPHPRMHLRAFVMAPLVEISPDCRIPGRGRADAWLSAVSMQHIEKLSP